MIDSMTAFSRVQTEVNSVLLCWEIKAVNHRYLDVSFRLPETLRMLEPSLRQLMTQVLSRGKVDCTLRVGQQALGVTRLVIAEELISAVVAAGERVARRFNLANDLGISQVMSLPNVMQFEQPAEDENRLISEAIKLFEQALQQLQVTRKSEGSVLKQFLDDRIVRLHQEIAAARAVASESVVRSHERLVARLQDIDFGVAESRIEQELALLLTKLDVSEELDRLTAHTHEVSNVLSYGGAVGRRLDFLMQELNREANTLSAKSDAVQLTQCAVNMKVLIEQMREQIQNIE